MKSGAALYARGSCRSLCPLAHQHILTFVKNVLVLCTNIVLFYQKTVRSGPEQAMTLQ